MTTMNDLHSSLALLFAELTDGPSPDAAYMLNPGDPGLLGSLDALSAEAASRSPAPGGASIAAHVDHVCYGLDLMNRWNDGEANPWSSADWTASWRRNAVTEGEWNALRDRLRDLTQRWRGALETPRTMSTAERNGVIGSIAHLAYHLGAIRQIDRSIQGPKATPPTR
jgi:DinB superfamily